VTVTVNGCTSSAGTTSVVVNPIPSTPTASNGGPYCAGSTIALSTPTVTGATYAWTGPNAFTSALQNPTIANSTTANAGTYSVTVTVNGCTSAAGTTSVVVNPIPATPTASNGGPYCEGDTIQLNTPAVTGATYAWSGPNGFTSTLQNPTIPNCVKANQGTYAVTVTVNGCTSPTGSTTVTVDTAIGSITIAPVGPTTFCTGGSVTLNSNFPTGNHWYLNGVKINGAISQSYVATAAGSYQDIVSVGGCSSASNTITVTVNPIPATPAAANGGPYCTGSTIALSTPAVSGATYAWSGPNGFTSAAQNPTIANSTTANAGTYSVTVTVSGCTSAAGTTAVTVTATPSAAITTASTIGSGMTGTASVAAVSGATYSWSIVNGTINSGGTTSSITFTAGHVGTLTLTATVTNNGCSDTKSANVTVSPTHKFDPNGDGVVDPADIFYLVNYLFLNGPAPQGWAGPVGSGDANQDGVVDPADIFFTVNYLFLNGPAPAALAPRPTSVARTRVSGSIVLGEPQLRDGRWIVPVIAESSEGPQAIAMRVKFSGDVSDATVHRAGATAGLDPMFEIARARGRELSWIVDFNPNQALAAGKSLIVGEIEFMSRAKALHIDLDPSVTMISNANGTAAATRAAGTLLLSGTTIHSEPAPVRTKEHQ
jgi:hypothetical protein